MIAKSQQKFASFKINEGSQIKDLTLATNESQIVKDILEDSVEIKSD